MQSWKRIHNNTLLFLISMLLIVSFLISCHKNSIQQFKETELEPFVLDNPPTVLYEDDGIEIRFDNIILNRDGDIEISFSVKSTRMDAVIVRPSKININDCIVSYSYSQNAALSQTGGTERTYSYLINKREIAYAGITRIGMISMDISVISTSTNKQVCLIPVEIKTNLSPTKPDLYKGVEMYHGLSVSLEMLGLERRQFSEETRNKYFEGKLNVCILYYSLNNHGTEAANLVFDIHDDGYSVNGVVNNPDYRIVYPSYAGADAGCQRVGSFQVLLENGTDTTIESAEIPIRVWAAGEWQNIRIEITRDGNQYQVREYREDGILASKDAA